MNLRLLTVGSSLQACSVVENLVMDDSSVDLHDGGFMQPSCNNPLCDRGHVLRRRQILSTDDVLVLYRAVHHTLAAEDIVQTSDLIMFLCLQLSV